MHYVENNDLNDLNYDYYNTLWKKHIQKQSNIKNTGLGLFAKNAIKKGSWIAEFKGKLYPPEATIKNQRSNIYFNDEYILSCDENDLASFANDCINFVTKRRKLVEEMNKKKPFYEKHEGTVVNASIHLCEKNSMHKAYLVATQDIKKDEEIYVHYGFIYWFNQEMEKGFLPEKCVDENGFPEDLYGRPGFSAYIRTFYADSLLYKIMKNTDDEFMCAIEFSDTAIHIPLPNCNKIFMRCNLDDGSMTKI
jgi:SET domain-containing protein